METVKMKNGILGRNMGLIIIGGMDGWVNWKWTIGKWQLV
jgi:hypothetical protein